MEQNETLDRLKAEMELKDKINRLPELLEKAQTAQDNKLISDLAERVFFQRMLKDINNGMGEDKIDALIDRSVMIATKLFNKLYR